MMEGQETHQILVSLDSLLDSRLASAAQVSPEAAEKILLDGSYHARRHNALHQLDDRLDPVLCKDAWEGRNLETLKLAGATPIVELLFDIQMRYRAGEGVAPDEIKVELTVNTWPYKVDDTFRTALKEVLRDTTSIETIRFTQKAVQYLDPLNLARYDTVIWHEFDNWMSLHHEALSGGEMRETNFHCPEILVDPAKAEGGLPTAVVGNASRMFLADLFLLELMPLRLFSVQQRPTA